MAKSSFCMTDILNQNSQSSANNEPPKVVMLPLELLHSSKDNFYSLTDLEPLANSILNEGLEQPLIVVRNGAVYEINTGHRRMAALQLLVSWGYQAFHQAPCIIKTYPNELIREIALINTNATARVLSDYEKMEQAARLKRLFQAAEAQGIEIKGKKRALIAEQLNTSESQIARLESIKNNLLPDFQEAFKAEAIGISVAAELATLPEEQQVELHQEYQEQGERISLVQVKERKEQTRPANVPKPKENSEKISNSEESKDHTSTDHNQVTLPGYELPPEPEITQLTEETPIGKAADKLMELAAALAAYSMEDEAEEAQLIAYLFEHQAELDVQSLERGGKVLRRLWRLYSLKGIETEEQTTQRGGDNGK